MGVKKEKSWSSPQPGCGLAVGTCSYFRQHSYLGAPLSCWQPCLPLVPLSLWAWSIWITEVASPSLWLPPGVSLSSIGGHWTEGRERGPGFHSPNNSLPWHCGLTSDTSLKVTPVLTFVKEFHLFVLSPDTDTHLIWSSGQLPQLWVWILRFNSLISVLIFASQYHGASQMVQW